MVDAKHAPTVTVFPPQFPGEEDLEYWAVIHADGVGQTEDFDDLRVAVKDRKHPVWIAAKHLNHNDATVYAAQLALEHPERRYFVMPLRPSKKQMS
jgi:hypothetical protein